MDKYEEALKDLYGYLEDEMVEAPFLFRSCLDTLKELIDKKDKQFNAGFNEATKICSEKIIALEEKQEKYRWHDLRVNKNDLPTNRKEVLVLVYTYCHDMYVAHLSGDSWVIYDGLGEYELSHYIPIMDVLAWKYIGEFEYE